MTSEFDNPYIYPVISILLPHILRQIAGLIKSQSQETDKVSEAIQRHLVEVTNWSSLVQFYGMSKPLYTDQDTVALSIHTEARRFQSVINPATIKNENDILLDPHHILLLGEPGSGKTTTLKRVALAILRQSPTDEKDIWQYPIVIRLRESSETESLFTEIANILGLIIKPHEITIHQPARDSRGRYYTQEIKRTEMRIGDDKVEDAIPQFLNSGQVLLLLDGMDELKSAHRTRIIDEIVNLGRRLTTSKIIVSCRSGDYTKQMDGFSVLEICPLTEEQIIAIKDKWLGEDDTGFMETLHNLPYFDVADRPLLLTQLLFIYKRYGYFPEQPSQVYTKLINLLLEEWDAERGIKRQSHYAGFDPKNKAEFLSALSYQLTYSLEKTRFKEEDLIKSYLKICSRFRLPKDEARQVTHEIQTHTGIISLGPRDVYEFCHLSLQEYLCADYIVRSPLDTQSTRYLTRYSAPLAVAVTLSSNPSNWLANLILNFGNLKQFEESSMKSFLSRLLAEHPIFEAAETLGFVMLTLFKHYSNSTLVRPYLDQMLELNEIVESIANSLRWYNPKRRNPLTPYLTDVSLDTTIKKIYRLEIPPEGAFPTRILPNLKQLKKGLLYSEDHTT